MKETIDALVTWMQKVVGDAHAKGIVFGLSGGIDSAVIAGIAKRAFGDDALGIIMPIDSHPQDEIDALLVAEALDLKIEKVDLSAAYHAILDASFVSENTMAKANLKPRLRMSTLYYYGQDRNYLVSGSSNASEYYVGYFTKFGDSACDLMPLVDFVKEEVFALGEALGLPEVVLKKKPTAGLYEGQTDELEMGFSYKELDAVIREDYRGEHRDKIDHLHKISAHKRVLPPKFGK
ncbi:NAD+ synthase [Peptoniphilus ivorii]|uniref:NAD(+) synthase n=1 Tax=Aedoeadaptatus ivorii TaxID=54006 RepID=UPI00278920E3|nr:NAD(+) synthase [Peptoniphilus ivorii]MDQ0508949.1 NAD+ synthase [Peptoniphilus ivorii]